MEKLGLGEKARKQRRRLGKSGSLAYGGGAGLRPTRTP